MSHKTLFNKYISIHSAPTLQYCKPDLAIQFQIAWVYTRAWYRILLYTDLEIHYITHARVYTWPYNTAMDNEPEYTILRWAECILSLHTLL